MNAAFGVLVAFLTFVYFDPALAIPVLAQIRAAFIVSIGSLGIAYIAGGRPPAAWQTVLLVGLVAGAIASALTSPLPYDERTGIQLAYLYNAVGLYFLVSLVVSWPKNLVRFFYVTLALGFFVALVTLLTMRAGIPPLKGGSLYRMTNFFGGIGDDPNEFGAILLALLPFPVALMRRHKSMLWRLVLFLMSLVFVLCIVRTRSRGAFIGLLVVALIFLWENRRRFSILLLIVAVAGYVYVRTHETYWERISTLESMEVLRSEGSAESRMLQMSYALKLMERYPVLGVGPGNFVRAKIAILRLDPEDRMTYSAPHNSYLGLGAEMGPLVMLLFIAVILVSLARARASERFFRERPRLEMFAVISHGVWVGLAGLSASVFFLSEQYNSMLYQWVALAAALHAYARRELAAGASQIGEEPTSPAAALHGGR